MPTFRIETAEGAFDVDADSEQQALQSLSDEPGFIDKAKALVSSFPPVITADALATIGAGTAGAIAGGITGLATSLIPGTLPGSGAAVAEDASSKFARQPVTPGAAGALSAVGQKIQPVAEAFEKASEASADVGAVVGTAFGAPVLGQTAGKVLPAAIFELLGLKGFGALRGANKISGISDLEAGKLAKQGINIDDLSPEQVVKVQQDSVLSSKDAITNNVQKIVKDPKITVLDEQGLFTPEAIEALRTNEATRALANEAETFNLFQRRNIPASRADISQNTDLQRQQQDALKRSGAVGDFVASQDEALALEVAKRSEGLQPSATNLQEANANVFSAIDDFVQESEGVINRAYDVARGEAGNTPVVLLGETFDTLKKLTGPELNKPVTSQLKSIFRNRGLVNKDGSLKPISVTQAEAIRQDMNLLFDSLSPQGRRSLKEVKDAIDQDVSDIVGSNVFEEARRLNTEFNNKITRSKRNRRDKRRRGFLDKIIDNTIPETEIINKIKTQRADDVLELKNFLTEEAGDAGTRSWTDIKAQLIREALNNATSTQGKAAGGVPKFNVNKFESSFKTLRNKGTMDLIFDSAEISFIDDIIDIGRTRVPQGIITQGSGATGFAVNEALKRIPGGTAIRSLEAIKQLLDDKKLLDATGPLIKALEKQ